MCIVEISNSIKVLVNISAIKTRLYLPLHFQGCKCNYRNKYQYYFYESELCLCPVEYTDKTIVRSQINLHKYNSVMINIQFTAYTNVLLEYKQAP